MYSAQRWQAFLGARALLPGAGAAHGTGANHPLPPTSIPESRSELNHGTALELLGNHRPSATICGRARASRPEIGTRARLMPAAYVGVGGRVPDLAKLRRHSSQSPSASPGPPVFPVVLHRQATVFWVRAALFARLDYRWHRASSEFAFNPDNLETMCV